MDLPHKEQTPLGPKAQCKRDVTANVVFHKLRITQKQKEKRKEGTVAGIRKTWGHTTHLKCLSIPK